MRHVLALACAALRPPLASSQMDLPQQPNPITPDIVLHDPWNPPPPANPQPSPNDPRYLLSCFNGRDPPVPPCAGGYPWTKHRADAAAKLTMDPMAWKNYYEIPYIFDENVPEVTKRAVRQAMAMWRDFTCVYPQEYPSRRKLEPPGQAYVHVQLSTDKTLCQSSCIGRPTEDPYHEHQVCWLILGWCQTSHDAWGIARAFGVILGLTYENKREDALEAYGGHGPYIKVDWSVIPKALWRQYEVATRSYVGSISWPGHAEYDYRSIMHLPPTGFPQFDMKKIFTATRARGLKADIGAARHPSDLDYRKVNDIYACLPVQMWCQLSSCSCPWGPFSSAPHS